MIATSANDFLVISDSDILVGPDFLRNVIPPLCEPENGLVTCLYQGIPASGFWSGLEALGMSVEMPAGVITADMLEGMQFALGSVMAVRRDALEKCGGIASTSDYYSDDFVLGNRVHAAGYKVVLSHYRVGHVLTTQSFGKTFATQLRWMQSTRYSRPKGHLGTGLTFAVPFGVLGLVAATALGHPTLGAALLAWSLLNRIIQSAAVGYGVIGDRRALAFCWLYPLRDLLGFVSLGSQLLRRQQLPLARRTLPLHPRRQNRLRQACHPGATGLNLTGGPHPPAVGECGIEVCPRTRRLRPRQPPILQMKPFPAPHDRVAAKAGEPDRNSHHIARRNQPQIAAASAGHARIGPHSIYPEAKRATATAASSPSDHPAPPAHSAAAIAHGNPKVSSTPR